MPKYTEHKDVISLLGMAQDADKDQRERAREAHVFVDTEGGQWEDSVLNTHGDRPRYEFDMVSTIVDQIAGQMELADFDINVKPKGGEKSKEDAKLVDGLIRNIETISNASHIFNMAARNMVTAGIDGWRVHHEFIDDKSFNQDLVIKPVHNFTDRVWFDPSSQEQDRSDCRYSFLLSSLSKDDYDEKFSEGSGTSVSQGKTTNYLWANNNDVVIGRIFYKKKKARNLHMMSNNNILEETEDFDKIKDELAKTGVTITRTRKRDKITFFTRQFDGSGWLSDEEETPFSFQPLIPTYGNFKVFENVTLYRGVVTKMMDSQRVFNYSQTREIEEGALAPRSKYWATETQIEGHADSLNTMNTNNAPVQLYNVDPDAPGPPQQQGGAQINPGLRTITENMKLQMNQTAGMFAASMGDNPGLQSGVAIERLQNKGDVGTTKYFSAQEVAICHTARILVDAIPRVYDTARILRIIAADGSISMEKVNEAAVGNQIRDEQTGQMVKINDLSGGEYDVTCSSGPSFQNRQQETVSGIIEVAQVDPSIIQLGGDILLRNITTPGMDLIADRKRVQLLQQGLIPVDQMTDEEKQQLQEAQAAQQGNNEPTPEQLIGQAEMIKAQNEQAKTQISVQEKSANIQLAGQKFQLEQAKFMTGVKADNSKLILQQRSDDQTNQIATMKIMLDQNNAIVENLNTQAATLKLIREAMGIDTIVGPHNQAAYVRQAALVVDSQNDVQ